MNMATKTELERLDDVLAAYGGDRTRWPAPLRLELSQLLANSPEARAMLEEAQALDALLDMAPAVPGARMAALTDRIVAQAARTPRVATSSVPVSPVPVARPKPASAWKRHATGLSALAASLIAGVFAGQNGTVAPAVADLATAVGIESLTDGARVAATDETYVGIDEDML